TCAFAVHCGMAERNANRRAPPFPNRACQDDGEGHRGSFGGRLPRRERSARVDPQVRKIGNWRTALSHVSAGLGEGCMSRSRAADDFTTIRSRMEELRREKLPEQPAPPTDTNLAGYRCPCACGTRLFPDEGDGA